MWPSTGPLLHGTVTPALTAAESSRSPWKNAARPTPHWSWRGPASALEAFGLPGAHEVRKVSRQADRCGQVCLLGSQLGQLLFGLRAPRLRAPEHQPGGLPRRELAVLGLRHERKRLPKPLLPGSQPLRLPEALRIASHGGIAPPVALLLEEVKHLQGVMAPTVAGARARGLCTG